MDTQELEQTAVDAGLIDVSDAMPGLRRVRRGEEFEYLDVKGRVITDTHTLIGSDTWRSPRLRRCLDLSASQWALAGDGEALPLIRERVDRDLRRHGMPREKALAVVVCLWDRSHIRIGNDTYAKVNRSYGLTTPRNRHVRIDGSNVKFR